MSRRGLAALVLAVTVGSAPLAACGDDDDGGSSSTSATAPSATDPTSTGGTPGAATPLAEVELAVEEVASLDAPIALVTRPGTQDLYVAEKGGRVVRLTDGEPAVVTDISDEVLDQGEQGLLGMAFSSDGTVLYLDFIARSDASTRVIELTIDPAGTARGRRELLRVEQPFPNHNGGHLVLGPDGYLYIGLGDGGSGGDPMDNAQDTDTLLGSILRIDPTAGQPDAAYAIPADNPFAAGGGAPEIWLYGARNPWRFAFDRATGDLWVADVGQGDIEEIDLLPATDGRDAGRGANLGWNLMEGTRPFEGENPPDGVLPVHEYTHDDGCSVTGGHVYRGTAIPALDGAYLFADYCEPDLRAIRVDGGDVVDERSWDLDLDAVQSFAEDATDEIYVLLASGPVLRLVPG